MMVMYKQINIEVSQTAMKVISSLAPILRKADTDGNAVDYIPVM